MDNKNNNDIDGSTDTSWLEDRKLGQEDMLLKYQERLNFWGDEFFEQCNPLARCGIFSISNKAHEFYQEPIEIRVVGDGKISYTGWRLSIFDEDVFLQLLHYMRGQSLVKPFKVSKGKILKDLGLNTGGNMYTKLDESIVRLRSAEIEVSANSALQKIVNILTKPHLKSTIDRSFLKTLEENYQPFIEEILLAIEGGYTYNLSMRFLQNAGGSDRSPHLVVKIDPLMVLLYDGIHTTRVNRYERQSLCAAEKRLLEFTQSHRGRIYDLTVESYAEVLGSGTDFENIGSVRKFKANLKKWFSTLEKINRIEPGWTIDGMKVKNLRPIGYQGVES